MKTRRGLGCTWGEGLHTGGVARELSQWGTPVNRRLHQPPEDQNCNWPEICLPLPLSFSLKIWPKHNLSSSPPSISSPLSLSYSRLSLPPPPPSLSPSPFSRRPPNVKQPRHLPECGPPFSSIAGRNRIAFLERKKKREKKGASEWRS